MSNIVKSIKKAVSSLEQVLIMRRRSLVRNCLARGLRLPEIVQFLSRNDMDEAGNPVPSNWFPITYDEKQKFDLVKKDISFINNDNLKVYTVDREEADAAMVEYLERQTFLYQEAISHNKFELARDLSKDIAKARGVNTEEPVRIETDIATLMRSAFAQSREKKQIAPPQQVIEIEKMQEPEPILANGHDEGRGG